MKSNEDVSKIQYTREYANQSTEFTSILIPYLEKVSMIPERKKSFTFLSLLNPDDAVAEYDFDKVSETKFIKNILYTFA